MERQALQALAVTTAYSRAPEARAAAEEFYRAIWRPDLSSVLFFCSARYDLDLLGQALGELFGNIDLVGCTTAGEITPEGLMDGSLTGVGFAAPDFCTVSRVFTDLDNFSIASCNEVVRSALAELDERVADKLEGDTFAFLMIDGMSGQEEQVVSGIYGALGDIPLLGGSAGDDLTFVRTLVHRQGRFYANSAVLFLVHTSHPFKLLKTEHFQSFGERMVVTEAESEHRKVIELNAEPAADEYARVIGVPKEKLDRIVFASHPLVVRVGGEYHVRSIQQVNDDDSLTFHCAIDEGIILTAAEGGDIVSNLSEYLEGVNEELGQLQVVLGCDCMLRRLEMERKNVKSAISDILRQNKVVGFNTYGEQYNSMHVNQTFTGIAIGCRKVRA